MKDYPHSSRVHPLSSFDFPGVRCFVKRDDELGFGISGSKLRKYRSLFAYLEQEKIREALLIGAPFSNHILSMAQLLRENKITPILFLIGTLPQKRQGNFLLSSLFLEAENIHWFSRKNWETIDAIANEFVQSKKDTVLIAKGASMKESLPGTLTLATDILENEKCLGLHFDHVFIDSGTGMMASALILAFAWLQKKSLVHVIQIAGTKAEFEGALGFWKKEFEMWLNAPLNTLFSYRYYVPENAKSFGATNAKVFQTIKQMAKEEGMLTDPIYTAKLFFEGKRILQNQRIQGNVLFIHSGGGLTLGGFQDQLEKILKH